MNILLHLLNNYRFLSKFILLYIFVNGHVESFVWKDNININLFFLGLWEEKPGLGVRGGFFSSFFPGRGDVGQAGYPFCMQFTNFGWVF